MMMVAEPMITIGIVCYNYGQYLARAITSVLAQKLDVPYELLIADDASTDNSREVMNSFAEKHPESIRLILNEKNQGPVYCAWELVKAARGKYIAWLDADDYWSFQEKLRYQIDFLERHPGYSGCFHDSEIISEMNSEEITSQSLNSYRYYSQFNQYSPDFEPLQLLMRNIIPTASLVFRNRDFSDFFSSYNLPLHSFSWAFQMEIIKAGKFRYFNKLWSVYYDHAGGLSKKLTSESFSLNNIRILKRLTRDPFYRRYRNRIWQSIAHEYDCVVYKEGKVNISYALRSQCSYFKTWWWTAWYYKLEILKKMFGGR